MVKFNKEFILILKKKIYERTGQMLIVRDFDLLDSAMKSVYQTFGGQELYPSIEEKGARLGFNIINNHPFIDGNKRFGILAMLCFLEINDVYLKYSNNELIDVGLSLASGTTTYEELVSWVNSHKTTTQQVKKEDEHIK